MIVFSYDRPMQLYAFLESVKKYVAGLNNIFVIYRVSDQGFEQGYGCLKKEFLDVEFLRQKDKEDFRRLSKQAFFKSSSDNIIFAVDDIIIKDEVDLTYCASLLHIQKAYGFYLRLGKNISECYAADVKTSVPKNKHVERDVFKYKFSDGEWDWCYPNTVDMTLFKKRDIALMLFIRSWASPNRLEGVWASLANKNEYGLFFEQSKIVNIPANLVQSEISNRMASLHTAKDLLIKFKAGKKIDISDFYKINNKAPHMEKEFNFIQR